MTSVVGEEQTGPRMRKWLSPLLKLGPVGIGVAVLGQYECVPNGAFGALHLRFMMSLPVLLELDPQRFMWSRLGWMEIQQNACAISDV
jgi:hypothetical protein